MKAFLMHPQRDFDLHEELPANADELVQDLELETLFQEMAQGDSFLHEIARRALLCSLSEADAVRYRQDILRDCLKNTETVRELYQLAVEAGESKRRQHFGIFSTNPSSVLSTALELMGMFVVFLKRLKTMADEQAGRFASTGFQRFFAMIQQELRDDYFALVDEHLRELKFREGVLISARLGAGNEGMDIMLRKPNTNHQHWLIRLYQERRTTCSFVIADRDEAGGRALSELRDHAINRAANALAQSADHVESFFKMLQAELAFYIGCLNLNDQLAELSEPITFPEVLPSDARRHTFEGLYDICLALLTRQKVVGNDGSAGSKNLVVITGANQGGKSTFLRSIGQAQLMMQSGMFVPAQAFSANLCEGLFTHYKRQEDSSMKSGKLDEELNRMSATINLVQRNSMVLFNESFAATNEREGSEIARQITTALLKKDIKVFFVTHQYEFSHGLYDRYREDGLFLRAERQEDGSRTFKLHPGEPLQTSFGIDVYNNIRQSSETVDT